MTKRLFNPSIEVSYGPIKKKTVFFEVVKTDDDEDKTTTSYNYNYNYNRNRNQRTKRQIMFSNIHFNDGNAINNLTKQFVAPIKGWYVFQTTGKREDSDRYLEIKTVRLLSTGQPDRLSPDTETITQHPGISPSTSIDTAMFSRYLEAGNELEIWEYGYQFSSSFPFIFSGTLIFP